MILDLYIPFRALKSSITKIYCLPGGVSKELDVTWDNGIGEDLKSPEQKTRTVACDDFNCATYCYSLDFVH